jgi:hypothetical protein
MIYFVSLRGVPSESGGIVALFLNSAPDRG